VIILNHNLNEHTIVSSGYFTHQKTSEGLQNVSDYSITNNYMLLSTPKNWQLKRGQGLELEIYSYGNNSYAALSE
jgi:hypothetical protein